MQLTIMNPIIIHLPTGILLKTFVENSTPVIAPNGDNNKDNPKLASLNWRRYFIPGMAATQIPNSKLEAAKRNPTASTSLYLINDRKFFSSMYQN